MRIGLTRQGHVLGAIVLGFGLLVLLVKMAVYTQVPDAAAETGGIAQIDILSWEGEANPFWFTVRLSGAAPETTYLITTVHHTDLPYAQDIFTATTDAAGNASARVWSACMAADVFTGTVYASLWLNDNQLATSPGLACQSLGSVADFGSSLAADSSTQTWIYHPESGDVEFWVEDGDGRSALTGTGRILSAQGYDSGSQVLSEGGDGRYRFTWTPPPNPDPLYRVQLTLDDNSGGHSGIDAFLKMTGRAAWIWGEAVGNSNPVVWALLTNEDYDGNGRNDRDEWLSFMDLPHGDEFAYASTAFLSVYPYISHTGYTEAGTFQSFLTIAHAADLKVEALAGTFEWVNADTLLQDGKDTCDAILDFNRAGAGANQRFDGIHLDVEHDNWGENQRWDRFLELLTYCRNAIDVYNQAYEPIVLNADIPPHFVTGSHRSGEVMSNWDVMAQLDVLTLMDYRDFADVRGDGRTDGILPRADEFIADGNALGKPVLIGVELTPNLYNHVTFQEECLAYMKQELDIVAQSLAAHWAFQGLALHDYDAWRQINPCTVYLPAVQR